MMAKILITGNATLDIINHVSHYPREDEEMRALRQSSNRGGNASNTAGLLAQFSHDCDLLCTLGDDDTGRWLQQDLSRNKVDTHHAVIVPGGATPTSYITLNQTNGSRTIIHHRKLEELTIEHFERIDPDNYDWFHFEARNIEQLGKMLYQVGQHPQPVSLEVEKTRPGIDALIGLADVILFSRDFAQARGYSSMAQCLEAFAQHYPDKTLSCTWGDQGAMLFAGGQFYTSPAYPPAQLVDTIGAGDTFNAGLIHAMLSGFSAQDTLQFACKLAGTKCGQHGFENLAR